MDNISTNYEKGYVEAYNLLFEKNAFNLLDARKAFGSIKNIFRRNVHVSPFGQAKFSRKGAVGGMRSMGPLTLGFPKGMANPTGIPSGSIFMKNDLGNFLRSAGLKPRGRINPQNREMMNRLTGLHEKFEQQAMLSKKNPFMQHGGFSGSMMPGVGGAGHMTPGVILRESNALATMPKGFGPTQGVFHKMRKTDTTKQYLQEMFPGFQYGRTRLSRHAIKNMEKSIAARMEKDRLAALAPKPTAPTGPLSRLKSPVRKEFPKLPTSSPPVKPIDTGSVPAQAAKPSFANKIRGGIKKFRQKLSL